MFDSTETPLPPIIWAHMGVTTGKPSHTSALSTMV